MGSSPSSLLLLLKFWVKIQKSELILFLTKESPYNPFLLGFFFSYTRCHLF